MADVDNVQLTRKDDPTIRSAVQECWVEDHGCSSGTWLRRSSFLIYYRSSYLMGSLGILLL